MNIHTILFTVLFTCIGLQAVSIPVFDDPKRSKNETLTVVEVMPEFPGGDAAIMQFIATETIYPREARREGIEGRVFVSFVIDRDGKVVDVKVVRGAHELLNEEALRVINALPDFTPGMQDGEIVRVQYTVPINFKLTDSKKK